MSHEPFRDELVALAGSTAQDPTGFLEGLSPIHDAWHTQGARTYGFLLFHHRVVRYFNANVAPTVAPPIIAFDNPAFEKMGVQAFEFDLSGTDTLAALATFSTTIEDWHNTAHMAIGMATGVPMMDPRQNIFFRPFWQLHFFIDDLFDTALAQYASRAHPNQFVTSDAAAGHIEARHHGWVARI
jgi:hypothetical protein